MIFEKILRLLNAILISAAVARHLGPEYYGQLTMYMAIAGVFAAMAGMGAESINQSEIRRYGTRDNQFLLAAMIARLTIAVAAIVMFLLVAILISSSEMIPLLVLIPLSALTIMGSQILAEGRFPFYAKINSIAIFIGGAAKAYGVFGGFDITYFIYAALVENLIVIIIFTSQIVSKNKVFIEGKIGRIWPEVRGYFKLCSSTTISAVLVFLYFRSELFLINEWIGGPATGLWSIVLMATQPWSMIAAALLPIASNRILTNVLDENKYNADLVKLIRAGVFAGLLAVVFNIVVANFLLLPILGNEYKEVVVLISIASFSIIPIFIGAIQDVAIAQRRETNIVLKKVIVGLPMSIALLYVAVKFCGLTGAAISVVISYLVTAVALNKLLDSRFYYLTLKAVGFKHGKIS